jgi:hypothetical protein
MPSIFDDGCQRRTALPSDCSVAVNSTHTSFWKYCDARWRLAARRQQQGERHTQQSFHGSILCEPVGRSWDAAVGRGQAT